MFYYYKGNPQDFPLLFVCMYVTKRSMHKDAYLAALSIDEATVMPGYDGALPVDQGSVKPGMLCVHCRHLLREPLQTGEGLRVCRTCAQDIQQ